MTPFYTPFNNKGAKLYLSGPMSGLPNNNYDTFDKVAAEFRKERYRVCSPADTSRYLGEHGKLTHPEYLRFDFERVLEADMVIALPRWENSLGALAEIHMAIRMGVPVFRYIGHSAAHIAGIVDYGDVVEAMHRIYTKGTLNV